MDREGKQILKLLLESVRRELKDMLFQVESALEILNLPDDEKEKPDSTDRARGNTDD